MVEGTRRGRYQIHSSVQAGQGGSRGEFPGPVRRLFLRRRGLFEYISPGLLASSIISFASFGIIVGFGGVLVGGLIQDWANEEEAFSWAKSLNGK